MVFLTALAGAALCMALFGGGVFAGWKAREAVYRAREPSVESPGEEDARRAAAEAEAYRRMMDYSVETAYGLNRKDISA